MGNTFGRAFRVTTFGESHGAAIGAVVDGCPPNLAVTAEAINRELFRRRPGQSRLTTQRREADEVDILSGILDGRTLGTPIALVIRNADARGRDYDHMKEAFRPSHADFTYQAKYGIRAHAGGGRASARETAARVAAGAIAGIGLGEAGIEVLAWVRQVHDIECEVDPTAVTLEAIEATPVRCPDPDAAAAMIARIDATRKQGDSVGGVVEAVARGVPAGLGEPVFDKLDGELARAMISIPAAKGFEIGSGFRGTHMTGSAHNDAFFAGDDGRIHTRTNRSGGVQGGISNGEAIHIRVAFKPTATILRDQATVNERGEAVTLKPRGRHDPCVLPRAVPIVEAMMRLVLFDHWLRHRGQMGRAP
ncbi:MAG TPA: chorismate synthase [Kofleriaceae bacterium]|nr:chorismate synthase [Kofleriaceae bacterium]